MLTIVALGYAAVKFAASDSAPKRARIISDGPVAESVRSFVSANVANPDLPRLVADNFPDIAFVSAKNDMNGAAEITIRHKKAVAVWTDGERYYPLLENGGHSAAPFPARPRAVVFKGVIPADVMPAIKMMSAAPALFARTDFLEWVDGRRWDAVIFGGARILLPESGMAAAASRVEKSGILGKSFSVLDLRDPNRMLVK